MSLIKLSLKAQINVLCILSSKKLSLKSIFKKSLSFLLELLYLSWTPSLSFTNPKNMVFICVCASTQLHAKSSCSKLEISGAQQVTSLLSLGIFLLLSLGTYCTLALGTHYPSNAWHSLCTGTRQLLCPGSWYMLGTWHQLILGFYKVPSLAETPLNFS